ncbi:DUF4288 domain-containing protein [Deinococcus sp.]|uniref:DUF4288 domain-containing protein n=1 Tax=Deinococcus sp. TaxID=47478 RepID=UPI00345BC10A
MTIVSKNKLYIALVVVRLQNLLDDRKTLYREDFLLQEAISIEVAESLITEAAKREQTSYQNSSGETISVEFLKIQDINEYDGGNQLYSRHFNSIDIYERLNSLD